MAENVDIPLDGLGGKEVVDHESGSAKDIRISAQKLAALHESIGIHILNDKFGLGANPGQCGTGVARRATDLRGDAR